MLEEAQNLDAIKTLNEVKVYYDELKEKRELGIISEEEYKVKAQSYIWEINNLNEEIRRQEEKIEFLKDSSHGKSLEEVIKAKTKAEEYRKAVESLKGLKGIGPETISVVKASLDKVLNYFEEFGEVIHKPEIRTSKIINLQDEHLDLYKPGYIRINEKKPETHKLKVEEIKDEIKDVIIEVKEENIEKSEIVRVMCPYSNKKGDKCKVIAFGKTEVDAYHKLENHIKKHHPEKLMDIKKIYARA